MQLFSEEVRAARIIESQRGKRIGQTEATHIAAVIGFDADDGDNDFRRYAVFSRHLVDDLAVFHIEIAAVGDFGRPRIAFLEFIPRPRRTRLIHNIDNIGFIHRAIEKGLEFGFIVTAVCRFKIDKPLHIVVAVETHQRHGGGRLIKFRHLLHGGNGCLLHHRLGSRFLLGAASRQNQCGGE